MKHTAFVTATVSDGDLNSAQAACRAQAIARLGTDAVTLIALNTVNDGDGQKVTATYEADKPDPGVATPAPDPQRDRMVEDARRRNQEIEEALQKKRARTRDTDDLPPGARSHRLKR